MRSLKALIAEDNIADAELLVLELNRGGYAVDYKRVDRAEVFRQALSDMHWDIVFSDHSMPRFNSTQALAILRESGQNVPFIIVSGTLGEEAAVAALKAGANDYFVKNNLTRIVPAVERELREADDRQHASDQRRRYNALLDASPDLVFMLDEQGRFIYLNRAAESLFRCANETSRPSETPISSSSPFSGTLPHPATASQDDTASLTVDTQHAKATSNTNAPSALEPYTLLGKTAQDLNLPSDFVRQLTLDCHFVLQGETLNNEVVLSTPNGSRAFEYLLSPLRNPAGQVDSVVGVTRDIQDRKQAEQALQQSLAREQVLRHVGEQISQSLDISGVMNRVITEIGQYLQVDRCHVITLDPISNPDFPSLTLLGSYRSGEDIAPLQVEMLRPLYTEPFHIKAPPEQKPLLFMNASSPMDFPGYFTPIGEQSDSQAVLAYNLVYRGTFYGRLAAHQCRQPRQWKSEEVAFMETVATHIASALYQADLFRKEQEARQHMEESYELLQVYTKKLEQSNQELEHFATLASHDLQAPLRKVMAFSDMIRLSAGDKLPEECKDYMSRMQKAILRMQSLITGLLDLSRINRRGKPFKETDLREVLLMVTDELRDNINESHATLDIGPLQRIDADQDQIQQVLTNLLENALKFHQPGKAPEVHIESKILPNNTCQIRVQDNGIGIKPEYYNKIFETFTRLHGQEEYPGTGIGLSLVKKIIERHHGTIEVQSEPNNGSTFVLQLPAHQQ
jgi:signal transduction histidine kinase/PAS domain-containing protein